MSEYLDCIQRAQRLSVARDSFLNGDHTDIMHIKRDDIEIYLKWLVTHLHATKKFNQFLRVSFDDTCRKSGSCKQVLHLLT